MDDDFLPICKITPSTKSWRMKVMLVEASAIRLSKKSGNTYKRYVFIDGEGMKIQACAFGNDINALEGCLELFKTYELFIKQCVAYRSDIPGFHPDVQFFLGKKSSIRPITEDPIPEITGKPAFRKISAIPPCLATNEYIDIIAILVDIGQPRNKAHQQTGSNDQLQEIVLITEEKIHIKLTLWNELVRAEGKKMLDMVAERPIIGALHVKASSYSGISLSALTMANFLVNPPYPEKEILTQWKLDNAEYLDKLLVDKPYFQANAQNQVSNMHASTVADMHHCDKYGEFLCTTTFIIQAREESDLFYNACNKCMAATDTPPGKNFYCMRCSTIQLSIQKQMLRITIADDTGSLQCIAYDKVAEDLLNLDMKLPSHIKIKELVNFCNVRNEDIKNVPYQFQIKKRPTISANFGSSLYTVVTACKETESHLLTAPNTPVKPAALTIKHTSLTPYLKQMTSCNESIQISGSQSSVQKNLLTVLDEANTEATENKVTDIPKQVNNAKSRAREEHGNSSTPQKKPDHQLGS